MSYLALDPATMTGWAAWRDGFERPDYGIRIFRKKAKEHPGVRFWEYYKFIDRWIGFYQPLLIGYESPLFPGHRTARGNLLVSFGFEAILLGLAGRYGKPTHGVYPSSLKKLATGNGRASKEQMVEAARQTWRLEELRDEQDNEADALNLLYLAKTHVIP